MLDGTHDGVETMIEFGIVATANDGTDDGTLEEATTTRLGDEATTSKVDGQSLVFDGKAKVATITGELMLTGTQTDSTDEIETVETVEITDLGIDVTANDGTDDGTLELSTMTIDD